MTAFTAQQISDALVEVSQPTTKDDPNLLGLAISQAREEAHWCLRHHPANNGAEAMLTGVFPFKADYDRWEIILDGLKPEDFGGDLMRLNAVRLLTARAMHAHFLACREAGKAENERIRQSEHNRILSGQNFERAAARRAHWLDTHPLRVAFTALKSRVDAMSQSLGSIGPDGDMMPLLDNLDVALNSIGSTAALERKAMRDRKARVAA